MVSKLLLKLSKPEDPSRFLLGCTQVQSRNVAHFRMYGTFCIREIGSSGASLTCLTGLDPAIVCTASNTQVHGTSLGFSNGWTSSWIEAVDSDYYPSYSSPTPRPGSAQDFILFLADVRHQYWVFLGQMRGVNDLYYVAPISIFMQEPFRSATSFAAATWLTSKPPRPSNSILWPHCYAMAIGRRYTPVCDMDAPR